MKFELDELDNYYSQLIKRMKPIAMAKHLFFKNFYNQTIRPYAEINGNGVDDYSYLFKLPELTEIDDPNYFKKRSTDIKDFKKLFKDNIEKEITDEEIIRNLNLCFLNESIKCLDRCIYWYLNYNRNLDGYSLNTKLQDMYYAEFFIHQSIARYLGLAYTRISEINLIICSQIRRISNDISNKYEGNMRIKVQLDPRMGGMHNVLYIQLRYHIREHINLPQSVVRRWFEPSFFPSILKEERERVVYDISAGQNDPWYLSAHKRLATEYSSYCFLDGTNTYSTGSNEVDEYIYKKYRDWGYREHHIGMLISWMIDRLKNISANSIIRTLRQNIKNYDEHNNEDSLEKTKNILLGWL